MHLAGIQIMIPLLSVSATSTRSLGSTLTALGISTVLLSISVFTEIYITTATFNTLITYYEALLSTMAYCLSLLV